jgi:hypothetical protein
MEKSEYLKKSFLGSALAFLIATSCCWLPALIVAVGGGSALIGFSHGLEKYSGAFMVVGTGLLGFGIYQYMNKKKRTDQPVILLQSTITCPECKHQKEETMPTDACQYFYECENCKKILKPVGEDCCVFCSYGTVACPPIQQDKGCC